MKWFDAKVKQLKTALDTEKMNRSGQRVKAVCIHGDEDCVRCASSDFDAEQVKTTNWEALEEQDVRRVVMALPKNIREILRHNPGNAVLAGGFIRAVIGNETIHDADIFVPSEKEALTYGTELLSSMVKSDMHYAALEDEIPVQVIWRYPFKEAYEILEQFDYTIAKAAIWFDAGDQKTEAEYKSLCHERFYRDLARKMLVYQCDRDVERVESIPRLLKYTSYGYSIEPKDMAELVAKTCLNLDLTNGFEGMLKQLESCYTPAGSDEEWAKLTKKYEKPKPKPARSHDYSYGS